MEEDTITEHETQARGRLTGLAQGPAVRWQVEPGELPDPRFGPCTLSLLSIGFAGYI